MISKKTPPDSDRPFTRLDSSSMRTNRHFIVYHVDRDNKICFVNSEWSIFARENNARRLEASAMLGAPLMDSIADKSSRYLYSVMIDRIRREQQNLSFQFRCDSPGMRRWMKMEMFPLSNQGIGFNSYCVKEEPRQYVSLLADDVERSDQFIKVCGWCKKFLVGRNEWVEAEEAVKRLGLFDATKLPQLSHGMCPGCYNHYSAYLSSRTTKVRGQK